MGITKTLRRMKASPSSNMEVSMLSPYHLDAEDEDMFCADEAAIHRLPSELRGSHHCLLSSTESPPNRLSDSQTFCKSHSQISPEVVTSLHDSLKTLIFHRPAALDPRVLPNAHDMVFVGTESVMDKNL